MNLYARLKHERMVNEEIMERIEKMRSEVDWPDEYFELMKTHLHGNHMTEYESQIMLDPVPSEKVR